MRCYCECITVAISERSGRAAVADVTRITFSIVVVRSALHMGVQTTEVHCGSNSTRYARDDDAIGKA